MADVDVIVERIDRLEQRMVELALAWQQRRDLPLFVPVARAAEMLGISVASARRRILDGSLKSKKLGSRVLIETDSIRLPDDAEVARAASRAVGR